MLFKIKVNIKEVYKTFFYSYIARLNSEGFLKKKSEKKKVGHA